jgi:hypothetical protein
VLALNGNDILRRAIWWAAIDKLGRTLFDIAGSP